VVIGTATIIRKSSESVPGKHCGNKACPECLKACCRDKDPGYQAETSQLKARNAEREKRIKYHDKMSFLKNVAKVGVLVGIVGILLLTLKSLGITRPTNLGDFSAVTAGWGNAM
jgi:hypothetical protein